MEVPSCMASSILWRALMPLRTHGSYLCSQALAILVERAVQASGGLLPQVMEAALSAVLNPAKSRLRNDDDRLTLGRVSVAHTHVCLRAPNHNIRLQTISRCQRKREQ